MYLPAMIWVIITNNGKHKPTSLMFGISSNSPNTWTPGASRTCFISSAHACPLAPLASKTNCSRGWFVENDERDEGSSLSIDMGFMTTGLMLIKYYVLIRFVNNILLILQEQCLIFISTFSFFVEVGNW